VLFEADFIGDILLYRLTGWGGNNQAHCQLDLGMSLDVFFEKDTKYIEH
jgi:hypothetical protein